MTKKSKKQPYRNALLKLKKERSSLDGLYKENQRLNANLLYRQEETQSLLRSAAEGMKKAETIREAALEELKQSNPYHPALFSSKKISVVNVEDALRYRIAPPFIGWNDEQKAGLVRLTYHKQSGAYETVAYGFSDSLIKSGPRYIDEGFIEHLGKDIARQLVELATTKMKEW